MQQIQTPEHQMLVFNVGLLLEAVATNNNIRMQFICKAWLTSEHLTCMSASHLGVQGRKKDIYMRISSSSFQALLQCRYLLEFLMLQPVPVVYCNFHYGPLRRAWSWPLCNYIYKVGEERNQILGTSLFHIFIKGLKENKHIS